MIKWKCAFNIPDSTIQVSEAFIKVVDYKNINDHSIVSFIITDDTGNVIIKEYTQEFDRTFENLDEIYEIVLNEFDNSSLV